jgi:hypothetical protein
MSASRTASAVCRPGKCSKIVYREPLRAPGAEDVRAGHLNAELGQHPVDLVLAAGPQLHQLAAVPGDLPQLTDLPRDDPRLGQPAHPQQVGQVTGVQLVVLDPAVAEGLHPERVGQVHFGVGVRQRIGRSVPAVAGLQHHLRVHARPISAASRAGLLAIRAVASFRPPSAILTSTDRLGQGPRPLPD